MTIKRIMVRSKIFIMRKAPRLSFIVINKDHSWNIASSDPAGPADVSPRGDEPGFVKVLDPQTLLIPDRIGNNRLDT